MSTHLFVYPGTGVPSSLPNGVTASQLPSEPVGAARAIDEVLRDATIEILVFWDLDLGPVKWLQVGRFAESLDDAWHVGARLSGVDHDDLMRFVLPTWVYRPAPPADLAGAVNWKLDLRACFLRASTVRSLGGLDGQFETLVGAARELGLRTLRRGGICRQQPSLLATSARPEAPSGADAYRLVGRVLSWKWQAYAVIRQALEGQSLVSEVRAWRAAAGDQPLPRMPIGTLQRDLEAVAIPEDVAVSVVLPTFGRYRYLAEVLDDLRAQTIRPVQILIADGNPPEGRDAELYQRYRDLPIEVIWHEEGGTCSSRNACLDRATGDFIWFVDDDSRFEPRNLELHLRALSAYGADVSVGPAYTPQRPELHGEQRETACSFMDCGTTVCRKQILDAVGGFDMQLNQYLAGEDGELGIRFVRAGGLMINNPLAKRFHYLAPIGGARRSKNNVHRWTRWSLLPRPVQSIYYTARRHFEPTVVGDALFQAALVAGWKRKESVPATLAWKARTLVAELVALPLTAYRLRRSVEIGRSMITTGPTIPTLPSRRGSARELR
jgi:GT2 family glycosyltransferase